MSGTDPTTLLNANQGQLSAILASNTSLWDNKGYDASMIFAVDNTARTLPVGQQGTFGGQDRFRFRKRGGRVHKAWLRLTISAGVVDAANRAAFVEDLAAAVIQNIRIEYASKTIHSYNGEFLKAYMRLCQHDIARETYHAQGFGGLPPGAFGGEAEREALVSSAFTLYVPLDWFWFTRSEDYALTPEALGSELDLIVDYRALEQLVYARVIATNAVVAADPFTTRPLITRSELCTQLIFEPHVQKNLHLSTFESRQGQLFKILDVEEQRNQSVAAAAGTYTIKLDNLRLDSAFLMFYMRSSSINTAWNVDRMQSDPTSSILPGGGSVAALERITSFRLLANGSTIVDSTTDIENRAVWRSIYFPGSQVGEAIYFIPWSWLLREVKHVSSFQNMNNLGSVELEIVVPARAAASILDAYSVVHNAVQKKKGDIVKALR